MIDPQTDAVQKWLVILAAAGGGSVLPNRRLRLQDLPVETEGQGVDVTLYTRFDDLGLTDMVPRELVTEVEVAAVDANGAVAAGGSVASGLATMISFAVNAYVPTPEPFLAYEVTPDLARRQFWQRARAPGGYSATQPRDR
jgi:hypothetical protein